MTTQTEYDPLKELAAVQKRMNQLFENALARTNFETSEGFDCWSPVCDVYETSDRLMLSVELPGLIREQAVSTWWYSRTAPWWRRRDGSRQS